MTTSKACFLVLGMHRSGTSAFARIVSFSGAALPKNVLGANEGNQTGHWEPEPIVEINDRMLAEFGSRWEDWRAFDMNRYPADRVAHYRDEIKRILREEYGDNPLIVLKEPRIARFVGLYVGVLKDLGYDIHFIHTMRHPQAVAASLRKRNGFPEDLGLLLWLRHVLDAEAATRGAARIFLSYEGLLQDPAGTAERLTEAFPSVFTDPDATIAKASEFVDKSQRHHAGGASENEDLQQMSQDVYAALRTLEEDEADAAARDQLTALKKDFDRLSRIGGSLSYELMHKADAVVEEYRAKKDRWRIKFLNWISPS